MTIERTFGVFAGIASGLAILYYIYGGQLRDAVSQAFQQQAPAPVAEAPPAPAPQPAPPPAATAPEFPVPDAPPEPPARPAAKPAPEPAPKVAPTEDVAASDPAAKSAIGAVFGMPFVDSYLVPDRVVQNIVTTIDSLDREPVPLRFRAIVDVPEAVAVERNEGRITLAAANSARYRGLMLALKSADSRTLAGLYLRYYPLLQRAWREMGYPDGYFNDRVVHVIDHLLAAPEIEQPIELQQPKVLYTFADPELEALSSGQKVMVRIGLENEATVKAKLREIRAILTSKAPTKQIGSETN